MATTKQKELQKIIEQKCVQILNELLRDEDNKYCVDCDSKGPRWSSWNIGVFLCIRCAGIHRNMGVHISKVKSVNLDAWTPEQVTMMQMMGNSRARAVYEANLPDAFRRPSTDSGMESFIRAKYELKKYIAKEWVPPPIPQKVDWSAEAEEILKRKKRGVVSGATPPTVPVLPQLPTPPSGPVSTPASSSSSQSTAKKEAALPSTTSVPTSSTSTNTTDVLLDISAGNNDSITKTESSVDKSAGETLLNLMSSPSDAVTSPSEESSKSVKTLAGPTPMSKESILALYGASANKPRMDFGGMPQQLGGMPQQLGGMPPQLGGMPRQQLGGMPQQLGGMPQQLSRMPQQLGGVAQQLGGMPQQLGSMPQQLRGVPMPQQLGSITSQQQQRMPQLVGGMPQQGPPQFMAQQQFGMPQRPQMFGGVPNQMFLGANPFMNATGPPMMSAGGGSPFGQPTTTPTTTFGGQIPVATQQSAMFSQNSTVANQFASLNLQTKAAASSLQNGNTTTVAGETLSNILWR
ncbi:unnamed protein product [Cyprideis torosa]|uniref:Uncharacterized protein n=1 Tax=Cyprideis torosa TaxID=163714 RepID=A0A7R8W652_9CRUS|nr:unnamed protein product [Cyprideis torosa]CAG0881392.1 unnamed protein product [Cyprideis torosa]